MDAPLSAILVVVVVLLAVALAATAGMLVHTVRRERSSRARRTPADGAGHGRGRRGWNGWAGLGRRTGRRKLTDLGKRAGRDGWTGLDEDDARQRSLDTLIESAGDAVLILDDNNRIQYASPAARTIFGTAALRGLPLPDLLESTDRRSAELMLRHARRAAGLAGGVGRADWTIRAPDGGTVLVEVSCRDHRDDNTLAGIVLTLRDVTAQRSLERQLTETVYIDRLTRRPNRLSFNDRLEQAVATHAGRTGVLLIDMDNLKAINDAMGHEAGDVVLRRVGDRLDGLVGERGIVARLGDDEFAVLLPDTGEIGPVEELASGAVRAMAEPFALDGGSVSCTASVGVATATRAAPPRELLRNADLALQAAKSAGHGQWKRYEPSMTSAVYQRLQMRAELRHALDEGSLLVEYQPILALDTGRTVGFEALVRMWHSTRGRLMPDEFIDVAEESGLITEVGERVLAEALRAAAGWSAVVPDRTPYVSVNVSPRQFRTPGFVATVRRLLDSSGVPATRLVLEITENLLLQDDDEVWENLRLLRGRGVRIAIDDFGTGYSALGYLRQVPLDVVKLDRVFISTLTSSVRQRELVAGIVRLTRALSLATVAEGIETQAQCRAAAAVGCEYGQGFLFSRSMPDSHVPRWLRRERQACTG